MPELCEGCRPTTPTLVGEPYTVAREPEADVVGVNPTSDTSIRAADGRPSKLSMVKSGCLLRSSPRVTGYENTRSFSSKSTALYLRHFFLAKYISMRLGPGASDKMHRINQVMATTPMMKKKPPTAPPTMAAMLEVRPGVEFMVNAIPSVISRGVILGTAVVVIV